VSAEIVIRCDGRPGGDTRRGRCHITANTAYPWHSTATKLRAYLRRSRGWHRLRDGRDICPDCWREGCHRTGVTSPRWCGECESVVCGCDPGDWTPLPGEHGGEER
jgi:hypothetical protein